MLEKGTITLCKVTMEKSAPMQFSGREKPVTFDDTSDVKNGKDLQKEMKKILKKDPALSKYESDTSGNVKVLTDSEDLFWITRCAMEEADKQRAVNGINVDVWIQHMELLAGDEADYLMKVKFKESYSISSNAGDSSYADMEITYRIMKGSGAYLAYRIGYAIDGSVGLNVPAMKQEKNLSDDKKYCYYVPAIYN